MAGRAAASVAAVARQKCGVMPRVIIETTLNRSKEYSSILIIQQSYATIILYLRRQRMTKSTARRSSKCTVAKAKRKKSLQTRAAMNATTHSRSDCNNMNALIENGRDFQSHNREPALFAPSPSSARFNSRSCVTCRRRKVRCGKSNPCSNCIRAGIECIFPTGRAKKETRQVEDGIMVARLKKLEDVIQSLGVKVDEEGGGQQKFGTTSTINEDLQKNRSHESQEDESSKGGSPNSVDKHLGKLVINEGQAQYVSNLFWANMSDENVEIRDILNTPSSGDRPGATSPCLPSPPVSFTNHQEFLFGQSLIMKDLHNLHPSQTQSFLLLLIFEERFDPLVRIIHRPTVRKLVIKASSGIENLSKAEEALLFSIYYGAVCSLNPEECQDQLGAGQEELANRFRFAVEQGLARADFLNTTSIVVLQAFILFLICLRSQDNSRMVWSLIGLITNLAQSLGVHRDGTNFGLSPFETEMRRRLWWHISLLDSRATEDHGVEPSFTEAFCDAKLPLNINDEDISPDTKDPPKERAGTTEMTFCLIRLELSQASRRINSALLGITPWGTKRPVKSLKERENLIEETHKLITERYVQHCDVTVPIYWASATLAGIVLAKMWLMAYHPLQYSSTDSHGTFPQDVRDRLFATSVKAIEDSCLLEKNERAAKWGWLFRTYMQWHAVAFVLSELCYHRPGPEYERAWKAVDSIYFKRVLKCPKNQKDTLWRPMRQLVTKAQAIREARNGSVSSNASQIAHRNQNTQPKDPWQQPTAPEDDRDFVRLGSARSHMDTFGLFDEPTMSDPSMPPQKRTQMQRPSGQTPVERNLEDMDIDINTWLEQEQFSQPNADAFSWPRWNSGALNIGNIPMSTDEFDQIPAISAAREFS